MCFHNTATADLSIYDNATLDVGDDLITCRGAEVVDGGYQAEIRMYGGDVNIDDDMILGSNGQGGTYNNFVMDGGTVDTGVDSAQDGNLYLAQADNDADSYLTLNGGAMTIAGTINLGETAGVGADTGQIRVTIAGGTLQGADLIDAGTVTNTQVILTAGYLKILGTAIDEGGMEALVGGLISCPNGYDIYTETIGDDDYTVLTVPEPSTLVLLLGGVAAVLFRRRKR
jgi:hypothetical protein